MTEEPCAVCLSRDGFSCRKAQYGSYDAYLFDCEVCGRFIVSRTAIWDTLAPDKPQMTPIKRALLTHHIRLLADAGADSEMWTTDRLERLLANDPRLPSPAQQATSIIRLVGDAVISSGTPVEMLPPSFSAKIGAPSHTFAVNLLVELRDRGFVTAAVIPTGHGAAHVQDVGLTLTGWQSYESEKQGQIAGSYGFVALKFGDPVLDPLLRDHIKPAVRAVGYELVDLRDVARAGVIDNLLRVQIRDAAFVLVDLTHENAGAYWEAGYAEGLGKPVLYLCERSKFEEKKTHFDTNHCTTVLWDTSDTENFKDELIATIRRSLGT
jgi:hypothetical protein